MKELKERLLALFSRSRIPQALLLTGSDEASRTTLGLELTRALLCLAPSEGTVCGVCSSCRKLAKQQHPDFYLLAPQGEETRIDQVRAFHRWLAVAPHEGPRKVGLIQQAENLNRNAANALLKAIEEPPPYAILILLARSKETLLPTVRSRCLTFRVPGCGETVESAPDGLPEWAPDLRTLLDLGGKNSPETIFRLTEQMGKNRAELPCFFRSFQATLLKDLKQAREEGCPNFLIRRLEKIFDEATTLEYTLGERHGNVALNLDRLLLCWCGLRVQISS